jgi:Fe2+ transport system protein B
LKEGLNMLQFVDAGGYTWYINHLISFIVLTATLIWACKQSLTGHKDKFLHTAVSALITLIFIWFFNRMGINWWVSPIIALSIGVAKEIWDYFHPKTHTCDIKDLGADFIGVASVAVFYWCSFIMAS